jgi:hypothetical protein
LKLTFDRDNQLGDDGKHLSSALFEHIERALDGQEAVRVGFLPDSFEEDWQVVMVVQLSDVHFPVDPVVTAVLNGDGQVSAVVEASEFRGRNEAFLGGSGLGLGNADLQSSDEFG